MPSIKSRHRMSVQNYRSCVVYWILLCIWISRYEGWGRGELTGDQEFMAIRREQNITTLFWHYSPPSFQSEGWEDAIFVYWTAFSQPCVEWPCLHTLCCVIFSSGCVNSSVCSLQLGQQWQIPAVWDNEGIGVAVQCEQCALGVTFKRAWISRRQLHHQKSRSNVGNNSKAASSEFIALFAGHSMS